MNDKMQHLEKILFLCLILGLLLAGCVRAGDLAAEAARKGMSEVPGSGDVAPDFIILLLDDSSVQLSSLRGQPVVLYFRATWCGSCKFDIPVIESASREWAGTDLTILMVNVGQGKQEVWEFVDEGGYSLPIGLDGQMKIDRAYRILGFPSTYFIDRTGSIQHVQVGPISREVFLERVAQLE